MSGRIHKRAMSEGDDEMGSLVETIVQAQTESKLLALTKREARDRFLELNYSVCNEAANVIRQEIADKSGFALEKVVVNWGDARAMRDEVEVEDGTMYVSVSLVHKIALEVAQCTAESASSNSAGKPYLKLTGGGRVRGALTGALVRRFDKAWADTKTLGQAAQATPKIVKALEGLAEFAMAHAEDVLAMVQDLEEEGIGPSGIEPEL